MNGKKSSVRISMQMKILLLAISTLVLLVGVSAFTSYRLNKVNILIVDLAEYTIPVRTLVNEASVHAFEQILHLERVFKYYEFPEPPLENISHEIEVFEERGHLVDEEIHEGIELLKMKRAHDVTDEGAMYSDQLISRLEHLEHQHQQFHDHAVELLDALVAGHHDGILQLEDQLFLEEEEFNQEIHSIILLLEENTVTAVEEVERHENQVLRLNILATFLAIVIGLLYATIITFKIVKHVRILVAHMGEVQKGDYTVRSSPGPADEVGSLTVSFNSMVKELELKDKIEKTFGQYVDPKIVKSLVDKDEISNQAAEKRTMTVFFAEISGLDVLISELSPERLVDFYNDYLDKIAAPITKNNGVLNKFINTAVMGFWGPPFNAENEHWQLACEAAQMQSVDCVTIKRDIMRAFPKALDEQKINLTVGITTGPVIVGNMGSDRSKSYTVMGDVVNVASRLKGAARQYGVEILISDEVQKQLPSAFRVREIDAVRVIGRDQPLSIFQYIPKTEQYSQLTDQVITHYQEGLALYRKRSWEEAMQSFQEVLRAVPDDYPSKLFCRRIAFFKQKPPQKDWDGIWQLSKK